MTQVFYRAPDIVAGFADLAERARRSVVHLHGAGRGVGTGVVWQSGGVVLTNDHVVVWHGRQVAYANARWARSAGEGCST
jgi:serine protease Do